MFSPKSLPLILATLLYATSATAQIGTDPFAAPSTQAMVQAAQEKRLATLEKNIGQILLQLESKSSDPAVLDTKSIPPLPTGNVSLAKGGKSLSALPTELESAEITEEIMGKFNGKDLVLKNGLFVTREVGKAAKQ